MVKGETNWNKECAEFRLTSTLSEEAYLKCRVTYKIVVYGKLAKKQRLFYQILSLASIISAASVPALIKSRGCEAYTPLGCESYAAILSVIVTILVALEKLFHFREHWRNYDSIESDLRSEQVLYQTRSGVYKTGTDKIKTDADAFKLFVNRIEERIRNERADTIDMRTSEDQ